MPAETAMGSSSDELDSIFEMDDEKRERIAGIRSRVTMPNPAVKGEVLNIRVLLYQIKEGGTELYKKVSGEKFTNTAVFLNVEEVENPGIEKDLSLSKTLYQSIDRELTNAGLKWEDLPGRVLAITADYWRGAPSNKRSNRCPKCNGDGCEFCTVAGNGQDAGNATGMAPPTRYDAVFRTDMGNTGSGSGKNVATEF